MIDIHDTGRLDWLEKHAPTIRIIDDIQKPIELIWIYHDSIKTQTGHSYREAIDSAMREYEKSLLEK